ncbi:MAG: hypothetical protein AAF614_35180 [Chloroflexota bacterium]
MLTVTFFVAALLHLVFAYFAVRIYQQRRSIYTLLIIVVIFGLFYDNFIIAIGSFVGEGELLRGLNAWRFYIHALVTPTLILYGWATAKQLGIGWAQKPVAFISLLVLTLLLIALGSSVDIFDLALVPEIEAGTLRYVNDHTAGPPIPAIITIIVLIVAGAFIWRQHKWYVLCVGAIAMFILAGAGASILILSNIGEVILAGTIVCTDHNLENLMRKSDQTGGVIATA